MRFWSKVMCPIQRIPSPRNRDRARGQMELMPGIIVWHGYFDALFSTGKVRVQSSELPDRD